MRVIQPIVEGHGELEAVPVLLRRLIHDRERWDLQVGTPIRQHRSHLVEKVRLQQAVRVACAQDRCEAVMVIFDADDFCPKTGAMELAGWAREAAAGKPVELVICNREFESWFLAGLVSLRGVRGISGEAEFLGDPDSTRDAKGVLEGFMVNGYAPTVDQAALTSHFDLDIAKGRSRSFVKMCKAVGALLDRLPVLR